VTKHEITGRDYLSCTSYGFMPGLPRGRNLNGFWRNHFWSRRHEDERGRVWWTTRWPSRMFGWLYRLKRRIQPRLCLFGIHDVWDVMETDGSTIEGYCGECKVLTKPRKPHPPDPERVAESEKFDKMAEEYDEALEIYWAGGPCPDCGKTDAQGHEPECWNGD
jgi:hypothetical protein